MGARAEIRSPLPYPEDAGITFQVSSPCYWCPWYVCNRQVHEDLCVPMFADHIRSPTANFDLKLGDVGNLLLWQLGRYLS
jgi:hypothetical protein